MNFVLWLNARHFQFTTVLTNDNLWKQYISHKLLKKKKKELYLSCDAWFINMNITRINFARALEDYINKYFLHVGSTKLIQHNNTYFKSHIIFLRKIWGVNSPNQLSGCCPAQPCQHEWGTLMLAYFTSIILLKVTHLAPDLIN